MLLSFEKYDGAQPRKSVGVVFVSGVLFFSINNHQTKKGTHSTAPEKPVISVIIPFLLSQFP